MDKNQLEARYQLANSYMQLGQAQSAVEHYDILISDLGDGDLEYRYKAYRRKLDLANTQGEREAIINILTDLCIVDPEYDALLLFELGQFYKSLGEFDRAIDQLGRFQEKYAGHKDYLTATLDLGLLYQHNKSDVRKAMDYYLSFLNQLGRKKHEHKITAGINLAACYNALMMPEQAQATLKKYAKIG